MQQLQQKPSQKLGGQMLFGEHAGLLLPTAPQISKVGKQDLACDRLKTKSRQHRIQRSMGLHAVGSGERLRHLGCQPPTVALARDSGPRDRRPVADRLRGLTSREPARERATHRAHATLILRAVEPQASGRARRLGEPVALLPGAQQRRRDARSAAQLADANALWIGHGTMLHRTSSVFQQELSASRSLGGRGALWIDTRAVLGRAKITHDALDRRGEAIHPLADAAVLLCGATGGIGSALAEELHMRGARLALVGRDPARLDGLPVPGARLARDLRTATACSEAVRFALARHGRLDVLVNAVGVVAFGPLQSLPDDVLQELFSVNALSATMLAARAVEALSPGGAIVNISGAIAERNLPRVAVYGASKAAVRSLDAALARELRIRRIRVLDARPPHTETPLMRPCTASRPSSAQASPQNAWPA